MPHSVTVDRFGNIWASDADVKDRKGGQVFKFDKNGNVLLTLGKAGVRAEGRDTFVALDVGRGAGNGDVFVSDGHGQPKDGLNHRIVKFSKDGTFIKAWGKTGAGPGELNRSHTAWRWIRRAGFSSRIAGTSACRSSIRMWKVTGRMETVQHSGEHLHHETTTLYVSDSNSSATNNPRYKRGILSWQRKGRHGSLLHSRRITTIRPKLRRAALSGSAWTPMGISTPLMSERRLDSTRW